MNSCRLRIRVLQLCHGIVPKPRFKIHAVHKRQRQTAFCHCYRSTCPLCKTDNSTEKIEKLIAQADAVEQLGIMVLASCISYQPGSAGRQKHDPQVIVYPKCHNHQTPNWDSSVALSRTKFYCRLMEKTYGIWRAEKCSFARGNP